MLKCLLYVVCYCLLCIFIGRTNGQYAPTNQANSNKCDGNNKEYLVEKFFNLIFSEPQNGPPVCICVQMCPDQPTYCYPSGCMRPAGHIRIPDEGGTREIMQTKNPFISVIDARDSNALNDVEQAVGKSYRLEELKPHLVTSLPDLIRDRAKILFKYKKIPKIQVRYNLKEHVKHINMDKQRIDLNFMKKNIDGEEVKNKYFKSKPVKPHLSAEDLNLKFSKHKSKSPITAYSFNEFNKNTFKKRHLDKNSEDFENLKAAILLKRNIVPGNEGTSDFIYNIVINETKLKEIIENKGIITLDFSQDKQ